MGLLICSVLGIAMGALQMFLIRKAMRAWPEKINIGLMVLKFVLWPPPVIALALCRIGWAVAFVICASVTYAALGLIGWIKGGKTRG